jgi:short-subunit dehydrogenase
MAKKALVTGASAGIGRVFARALAKHGYEVTGVARNEEKLRSLVAELGAGHGYLVADLSTVDGQRNVAGALEREHYDLLVNNAGVGVVGGFTDVPVERTLAMMHLNCDALVFLAHTFLKKAQSGDALINVSSAVAFAPMPSFSVYCATKSFVTAFSEALWSEQKAKGVYVMGLCPGITTTDFQIHAGGRVEDLPKNLSQTPEEVVRVAIEALERRNAPTVISGVKNVLFAAMMRSLPRKTAANALSKMMPPRSS